MSRRIVLEVDPNTGKPLSVKQLLSNRKELDRDRLVEERKAKEQKRVDNLINPPPPPPTVKQFMEQLGARDAGKRLAQEKADQEAKAQAGPINVFRQEAEALKGKLYRGPIVKKMYDQLLEMADNWDREQVVAAEQAAKQAQIDADPMVKLAREYAAGQVKIVPAEFQNEAAECKAIADAGDASLAWTRMKALDEAVWRAADQKAIAARQSKAVTDDAYNELTTVAEQARERAEQSTAMIEAAQ